MHLLTWKSPDEHTDVLDIRLKKDVNTSYYAILSHRWGEPEDEVSFEDFLIGRERDKKGYKKLYECCKLAQSDGFHYVWVDTCCIDKASSAELSEAITSMHSYYERAQVCYAFLVDVEISTSDKENLLASSFSLSAWFTRGWTLQELIAPRRVKFFDRNWSFLGYKTDKALSLAIESITGIDTVVLENPSIAQLTSISKRMSWAARRKTTRIEDRAYSLMGIFGVYMPPLYGEGDHAFIRLQEAIMRSSSDHTIFAWTSPPSVSLSHGFHHISTMLALSPDQFQHSSTFRPLSHTEHSKTPVPNELRLEYAITNVGLSIRLPLLKLSQKNGLYAAFLACTDGSVGFPLAIILRTTPDYPIGHFWRTNCKGGPIERSERCWFKLSDREKAVATDVYVLPRLTSVSDGNIEPLWDTKDVTKKNPEETQQPLAHVQVPRVEVDATVLSDLEHVTDPFYGQLDFYRQAHQMLSTNQFDQLSRWLNVRDRLPKSIPHARNAFFCGRSNVLQELQDALVPKNRGRRIGNEIPVGYVISGMAGIGKTQVAVEFFYQCIEISLLDAVFWISAESEASILDCFRSIASQLRLVNDATADDTVIRTFLNWLSEFNRHAYDPYESSARLPRWLLVFEDLENAKSLARFWPTRGPGCVLVICRDPSSGPALGSKYAVLQPLSASESSLLFRSMTRKDWDFTELGQRLGGHPLAISQLAGLIIRAGLSMEELIRLYDRRRAELAANRPSFQHYSRDLRSLWSTQLNALTG